MKIKRIFIVLFLFQNLCFAQTQNWVLAASPFEIQTDLDTIPEYTKKRVEELQVLLPKMLLESFDKDLTREVSVPELIAKERYKLEVKKRALYKDYDTSIKKRDAFFLEAKSKYVINQSIKSEEKKILDIETKIKNIQKEMIKLSEENTAFIPLHKKIVSYNNAQALFSPSKKTVGEKKEERKSSEEKIALELEALEKNIDALISADIEVNGEYLELSLVLDYYPSSLGSFSFVISSPLSDISYAISQMYEKLLPEILSEKLVGIQFLIEPAEVHDTLVLHVDDEVLKKNESRVFIPKGEHSIFAESEGYEPISFVYNFDNKSDFELRLDFKKIETKKIGLEAKDSEVLISLNAENQGALPKQVNLNKQTYLGHIRSDEWSNFFLVQEKDFTKDKKQLAYLNFSIEDKIKKSRDRLYFSYGAVLFALPLYIFSFAYYNTLLESLQYGINVPQNIAFWETFSTISFVGTSILGVNMGLQLIFYLNDANKVIPR